MRLLRPHIGKSKPTPEWIARQARVIVHDVLSDPTRPPSIDELMQMHGYLTDIPVGPVGGKVHEYEHTIMCILYQVNESIQAAINARRKEDIEAHQRARALTPKDT